MRKVLIAVIGFAVVGIGTTIFVMLNLDEFVKDAIETYASEATGTQVNVAEVKLALESGQASIIGLKVSNPEGFSDSNIFELGMISTQIDADTLNQNPIMIDEVVISAPSVLYEINRSGRSNVDVLKGNLPRTEGHAENGDHEDDLRMIIRTLVIEGAKVKVRIAALNGAEQTVNLPKIEMSDIGEKSGGVTSVEIAGIISSKLLDATNSSVARSNAGSELGKSVDTLKKNILDKAGLE
ncbi:MAG: hypothetical protein K9M17_05030 [Mariprofundaceae bacterium]|nr:hypothetical protein [Mariprofundaceae bacterium]